MATAYRNDSSARVFISYARADGEPYAKYLHEKLIAEGIPSWWDREDLRRTSNWWHKIDEALESVEYLVAVLTPKILDSETCRKEWQWARRKGRCIVPVKAGMSFETPTVPRWLKRGHAYQALDLDQAIPNPGSEWQKFINDLNTTARVEKVPFMAGDLPEDFVARPEEFNKLLAMLIDTERSEPLAITTALRGAGGYGKTTLAKALCHDLRVQEAFDDGILWVTLGEKAENLTGNIRDCIQALSGERPDFAGEREAAAKLAELLAARSGTLLTRWTNSPGSVTHATLGSDQAKPLLLQGLFAREGCYLALEPHFHYRNGFHKAAPALEEYTNRPPPKPGDVLLSNNGSVCIQPLSISVGQKSDLKSVSVCWICRAIIVLQ